MKITRKLKIGHTELDIEFTVANQKELFKTLSFLDSIPSEGPNGEQDLTVSYRTPKNYEYFSIVSKSANMEYKFGQLKDAPGSLFAKGWEPIHLGNDEDEDSSSKTPNAKASTAPVAPIKAKKSPVVAPKAPSSISAESRSSEAQDILDKFGINF